MENTEFNYDEGYDNVLEANIITKQNNVIIKPDFEMVVLEFYKKFWK